MFLKKFSGNLTGEMHARLSFGVNFNPENITQRLSEDA